MTAPRKHVFLSYRVSDTSGETGRLHDALKNHFEEDQIFMDIDKIEPGNDFTEVLSRFLDTCDVMLCIIGPNWQARDAEGNPRIMKADDWVRIELATALRRNIRVVPVLVDGATLPQPAELPPDLEALQRRQAYEISNKRWRYDTEQLIAFLENTIGLVPKKKAGPPPIQQQYVPQPPAKGGMNIWLKIVIGLLAGLGVLAVIGLIIGEEEVAPNPVQPTVVQPAVSEVAAHVAGNWLDPEGAVLVLSQNGNNLTIQVYHNSQQTGDGTGKVAGNRVDMVINMYQLSQIKLEVTVDNAGSHMNGNIYAKGPDGTMNTIQTILTRAGS